ncbi:hypothetical protein G6F62_014025 [Rhizopus arrhizus]|nr:hypothetical protein G6F62_014025 [Rhizopus arrhizus]
MRTRAAGQRRLHADPRPHRGSGLAQFFLVHEHVVGAQQRQRETVGVAGIGQQLLGAFRVVLQFGRMGQRAEHAVGQELVGGGGRAVHDAVGDGLAVDGHRNGAAHAHVLQGVLAVGGLDRGAGAAGHVKLEIHHAHGRRDYVAVARGLRNALYVAGGGV